MSFVKRDNPREVDLQLSFDGRAIPLPQLAIRQALSAKGEQAKQEIDPAGEQEINVSLF